MRIIGLLGQSRGAACVVGRVVYRQPRGIGRHRHDYIEVFWVESGEGVHLINGAKRPLEKGVVVCLRESDVHDLRSVDEQGMTLVRIGVPCHVLEDLRKRHFADDRTFWGGTSRMPIHMDWRGAKLDRVSLWAEQLASTPEDPFVLEWFLVNFVNELRAPTSWRTAGQMPEWLAFACDKMRAPEHFELGVQEFVRLSSRSPEHVARATRKALGKTPTELITTFRLDYAAHALSMTHKTPLDISLDCGFSSLSHFYKLFKARFGISPSRYRRAMIEGVTPHARAVRE